MLKSAWLTTNRSCNCRCEWCYAQNTLDSCEIMDFEKAKLAVDELKTQGVKKIVLIGGEPTLYSHYFDLVKYIKSKGIRCSVASNGFLFSNIDFAKKSIEAGVTGVNISLKGITEEEYVQHAKVLGLKKAIRGYHNLKKLGFKPSFSYVIVDDDKKAFDDLLYLLVSNDISEIGFQFVKPVLTMGNEVPIMNIKSMGNFVEYMYTKLQVTNINYLIEISFPLCLIRDKILEQLIQNKRIVTCCHVQKGTGIVFDTDFKVLPCNHFAEYPFSNQAVDFSNPNAINELLNLESVKTFKRKVNSFPSLKCRDCNYWDICGGGCFTRWLYLNPNDYIK